MAKKFSYRFIGTLYGCPSVTVAAVEDGSDVLTIESPTGESANYPSAPWHRRYTREQFLNLPFYKNWNTPISRFQVELSLQGHPTDRVLEWPKYWEVLLRYSFSNRFNRYAHDYNANDLRLTSGYWEIPDGIVI